MNYDMDYNIDSEDTGPRVVIRKVPHCQGLYVTEMYADRSV